MVRILHPDVVRGSLSSVSTLKRSFKVCRPTGRPADRVGKEGPSATSQCEFKGDRASESEIGISFPSFLPSFLSAASFSLILLNGPCSGTLAEWRGRGFRKLRYMIASGPKGYVLIKVLSLATLTLK